MAKEVKVSIIVDDNGTMRLTEKSAKKLGSGLDKAGKAAQNADRQLKGAAQASSNSSKNFSKQAQGIQGGLVPAYATLAATVFAASAAFGFLKDAGNLSILKAGQEAYFAATGSSTRQLTQDIIAATDSQINFTDAAQAASIGLASGLNADQIVRLGSAAQDVSQILGRDLTDSFNRLVRGVTKAEPELLDELGIVLRLKDATEAYKSSLGITGELNAFQRSQAVTADVLGQVEEKYSRVLDAVGRSPNEFIKLQKVFTDLIIDLKELSVVLTGPIVEVLTRFPILIAAAFAPLAGTLVKTALPGIEKFNAKLGDLGVVAEKSIGKANSKIEKLNEKLAQSGQNDQYIQDLRNRAKKEVAIIQQTNTFRAGTIARRIQLGKEVTDKQIQSQIKLVQREKGIFSKWNAERRASYIAMLQSLERANKLSAQKIATDMNVSTTKMKISFIGLGATAVSVFAGIAGAARIAGTVITTALSALSWITLLVTLGALAYGFFRVKEASEEQAEAIDVLKEKVDSATQEMRTFAEVQNILYENTENSSQALVSLGKVLGNIPDTDLFSGFDLKGSRAVENLEAISAISDSYVKEIMDKNARVAKAQENYNFRIAQGVAQLDKYGKMSETVSLFIRDSSIALVEAKSGVVSLLSVMQGSSNENISSFAKRLIQEKEAIEAMEQSAVKSSPQVQAFVKAIKDLDEGTGSVKTVEETRKAVKSLGEQVESVTKQTKDNVKTVRDLFLSFYPESETDKALGALEKEKIGYDDLKKSVGGLDEAQTKRLATLNLLIPKLQSISDIEEKRQKTLSQIDLTYTKQLKGATNLQKAEITSIRDIAKKTADINNLEQQRLNITTSLFEKRKAEAEELRDSGKTQAEITQALFAMEPSARKAFETASRTLELRKAELSILERQSVAMKELADNAFQAFESNLESGIASLIKGTEKSFKDFALNITKGVLTNVADTLAKQMTTSIINLIKPRGKTVDEKIKEVFENVTLPQRMFDSIVAAGNHIAEVFGVKTTTASSSATDITAPPTAGTTPNLTSAVSPSADKKGFWEKILGRKKTEVFPIEELTGKEAGTKTELTGGSGRSGGIFSQFINDFGAVFDKNADGGFLGKMGNLFGSFGEGLMGLFKGLPDLLGGLFGGGGGGLGGLFAGIFGAAAGGIMPGGVTGYANGGIVKRPTLGLVGEGKMNEAVVPLPDGKAIPVNMGSGMGQNNNVTVNVSMDGQGNSQSQSNSDGQMGANMGKLIAGAVQDELQRQKRPGGILSPYGAA
jgi:hypothetical protein